MTESATRFVQPLTFAALTGHKVITGLWGTEHSEPNVDSAIEHIAEAQTTDILVVAPATADLLARFAHGLANDFLTTLYLATPAPSSRCACYEQRDVGRHPADLRRISASWRIATFRSCPRASAILPAEWSDRAASRDRRNCSSST